MKELDVLKEKLSKYTNKAFYVGGFVRDCLLNKENKDIDIEVFEVEQSKLEEILNECAKELGYKEVELVGKQFGVYKLGNLDISLPREEVKIGEKHTGFEIKVDPFLPIEKAQRRRDFTINTIYRNIFTEEIVDTYNGLKDLRDRKIKAVNEETFIEDSLRVFRAAQFASRFNFSIDKETIELCRKISVDNLPIERIFEETKKALEKSENPFQYFFILDDLISPESLYSIYKIKDSNSKEISKRLKVFLEKESYYNKVIKNNKIKKEHLVDFLLAYLYFDNEEMPEFLTNRQIKIIKWLQPKWKYSKEEEELVKLYKIWTKESECLTFNEYLFGDKWFSKLKEVFLLVKEQAPSGEEIMKKYNLKPSKEVQSKLDEEYLKLIKKFKEKSAL